MALLKLVFLEGQGNPSTEIPGASGGFKFKPRTEPELSTRDTHSTSAPPKTIQLISHKDEG